MKFILYQADHAARANALGAVINAQTGEIKTTRPVRKDGLDTLILWGHGDPFKLCGHDASALAQVIRNWKSLNPKLKTVEILTCNARHATGNAAPIANALKSKLHRRFSGTHGITVKALPVAVGGKRNAWSILLADVSSRSWVYVTAPGTTDAEMMRAQALIRFDVGPNGGGVSYTGNIATKANKIVADPAHRDRKWTMNYGQFNTLRAHLVKV